MKIYLAGPINGCTDEQANGWRSQVKALHANCLDPMVRDYRGIEHANCADIVEGDKRDIDECDALIVYYEKPSVGTSMEVLYAWERKKPIAIVDRTTRPLSPWLKYHSSYICRSIPEAIVRLMDIPTSHSAFTDA